MYKLPRYATIYQAEAVALSEGISWARSQLLEPGTSSPDLQNGNFDFFSDSRSVLSSLRSHSIRSELIAEIYSNLDAKTRLVWVPGHAGVPGNEAADWLANASRYAGDVRSVKVPKGYTRLITRRYSMKVWEDRWQQLSSDMIYRKLAPQLRSLRKLWKFKQITSALAQIFTGHSWLNAHQHRFSFSISSRCKYCKTEDESVEHFLMVCPRWSHHRYLLFEEMSLRVTNIGIESFAQTPAALTRYCNRTGRLKNPFRDI